MDKIFTIYLLLKSNGISISIKQLLVIGKNYYLDGSEQRVIHQHLFTENVTTSTRFLAEILNWVAPAIFDFNLKTSEFQLYTKLIQLCHPALQTNDLKKDLLLKMQTIVSLDDANQSFWQKNADLAKYSSVDDLMVKVVAIYSIRIEASRSPMIGHVVDLANAYPNHILEIKVAVILRPKLAQPVLRPKGILTHAVRLRFYPLLNSNIPIIKDVELCK